MAVQVTEAGLAEDRARPHISHTQVDMFDTCQLRWYLRYICKIRKPSTIQMMVGSVFHQVLAASFTAKLVSGRDMAVAAACEMFAANFDKQLLDRTCELSVGQIPAFFKDAGVALLAGYLKEIAPTLTPAVTKLPNEEDVLVDTPFVELELSREISGSGVDFVGVIDMRDNRGVVIDYKVVGKRWGKADMKKTRQAIAYGFLLDEEIPAEFHVGLRSREKPTIDIIPTQVTRRDIESYVGHLLDVIEAMRLVTNGEMEPRLSSGYCSERVCQHYFECRNWKMGMLNVEPNPGGWASTDRDSIEEAA